MEICVTSSLNDGKRIFLAFSGKCIHSHKHINREYTHKHTRTHMYTGILEKVSVLYLNRCQNTHHSSFNLSPEYHHIFTKFPYIYKNSHVHFPRVGKMENCNFLEKLEIRNFKVNTFIQGKVKRLLPFNAAEHI